MEITGKLKNVYGNDLIYPVCENAKLFAEISGTATLGTKTIQQIKALGYQVEVAPQQLCA